MGFLSGKLRVVLERNTEREGSSTPDDPNCEVIWFGQLGAAEVATGWIIIMMIVIVKSHQGDSAQLNGRRINPRGW